MSDMRIHRNGKHNAERQSTERQSTERQSTERQIIEQQSIEQQVIEQQVIERQSTHIQGNGIRRNGSRVHSCRTKSCRIKSCRIKSCRTKPYCIDHFIPKESEGRYYTLPFPVPAVQAELARVSVSYRYDRYNRKSHKACINCKGRKDHEDRNGRKDHEGRKDRKDRKNRAANVRNIVDLGLIDSDGRFLGWSGSARDHVFVGPYASTRGYLMTDIKPGQWKIIVGAYKIPEGGLTVRYDISYTPKAPRWYAGDLHVHSDASDGQHDLHTLAGMAQKAGLDFIAAANHNNYSENYHLPVVPGLTFLPAVEWTHYRGHMNFFGIAAPFDNSFVANSEDEMRALTAQAKAKGARISVNHPKCGVCPYLWRSEDCFDWVEVWNGPMRKANRNAIAWWHSLLVKGKKIPLVGGSDYHRDFHPVRFARPVTKVYAPSPLATDLLAAIAAGHCYVTSSVRGVALGLHCENGMMGDSVPRRGDTHLTLTAKGLRPGMKIKLVTAEGISGEWSWPKAEAWSDLRLHANRTGHRLTVRQPVAATWRFAYLVVVACVLGTERIRAISNPIYFTELN